MSDELVEVNEFDMTAPVEVVGEENDEGALQSLDTGIKLPTYNEIDDKKSLNAVKEIFKNFHYNTDDDLVKMYATPERLADYIDESIRDIGAVKQQGDRGKVMVKAAIAARFWYLAHYVDVILTGSKYGTNGRKKIHELLKAKGVDWSEGFFYKVQRVASRLTATDCWLLGARGATPNHLTKLAQIKDAGLRQSVMHALVDAVSDTRGDDKDSAQALKQFVSAINAPSSSKDFAQLESSDPTQVMEDDLFPDYTAGMKMLKSLTRMLKPFVDNDQMVDSCDAIGNIYVTRGMPDPEKKLEDAVVSCKALMKDIKTAKAHLDELLTDLDGLATGLTIQEGDE